MTNCNYIYDEDGLRWEENAAAITLLIDGAEHHFRPVRNGNGNSRVGRFDRKQVSHPARSGEYLYGEITARDLERIEMNGHIEVLIDGARRRIEKAVSNEKGFPASIALPDGTPFTTYIQADRIGGSGRIGDPRRIEDAIRASGEPVLVAASQLGTMPKSARAGAAAARARLFAVVKVLLEEGESDLLFAGMSENPDAGIHLSPDTYLLIDQLSTSAGYQLEDALVRGAVFTGAHGEGPGVTRVHSVIAACRLVKTQREGDRLAGSEDAEYLTSVLSSNDSDSAREALEMIVRERSTRDIACTIFSDAAQRRPGSVLTEENALMLRRVSGEQRDAQNREKSVIDLLVDHHPEVVARNWTFAATLGDAARPAIERAPLEVASSPNAPMHLRAQAAATLEERLEYAGSELAARVAARVEDLHPAHAMQVADQLIDLGCELRPEVLARLELARMAWEEQRDATAERTNQEQEERKWRARQSTGHLVRELHGRLDALAKLVTGAATQLETIESEAARLVSRSHREGADPHERDAVRLRSQLRDLSGQHGQLQRSAGRILDDIETLISLFLREGHLFWTGPERSRELGLAMSAHRTETRNRLEQMTSLRYPDWLSREAAQALAARAGMLLVESPRAVRQAGEALMAIVERTKHTGG